MISGIYKISFGGSKVYVGSAVNLNARNSAHKNTLKRDVSHCTKLQRAYNKYGAITYKFEIIEQCEKFDLRQRELFWINKLDSVNSGYNISLDTIAPMLGRKHTEETKKIMSIKAKGNKGNTGQIFSDERRANMSRGYERNK